ncbi:MAG TPA: site-2 protease family protein [Actinomycetota bacterium]|jgi:Zn-dependent protease
MQNVLNVLYLAIGLLIGVVVRSYAQALVATRLHDPTPRQMGRLTLNPRAHADPFGTLVLPGILLIPVLFGHFFLLPFAYAKSMPLNPFSTRRPDNESTFVALAGIGANVALAFVFGALFRLAGPGQAAIFVVRCLQTQVILAAMNIVPIPPLDGSRIVARFLTGRAREVYQNLDQYGALFMLVIFFIFAGPIFSFVGAVGNGICQVTAGIPCL